MLCDELTARVQRAPASACRWCGAALGAALSGGQGLQSNEAQINRAPHQVFHPSSRSLRNIRAKAAALQSAHADVYGITSYSTAENENGHMSTSHLPTAAPPEANPEAHATSVWLRMMVHHKAASVGHSVPGRWHQPTLCSQKQPRKLQPRQGSTTLGKHPTLSN